MQQKPASRSAYRLFSLALLVSLLFSSFRVDTISPVHAQEASTETPTPAAAAIPEQGDSSQDSKKVSRPIASQFIIHFKNNTPEEDKKAFVHTRGGAVVQRIDALDIMVIRLSEQAQGRPIPKSAIVESIEQDYFIDVLDDAAPPNDPRYPEQWALPAIGAPSAWAQLSTDAQKVTVAVVDSGICASHPDLAGRIVAGWDFLENDAVPQDDFGHGCSVSGVIAANMNDGIGIAGVAPNAQIMPLRVLNASGVGAYSDVAAAIVYAADHSAQVINLSLGGSNPSSSLEDAVNYAISKGVIVVAAAGNNGTEGALFPAAYPDVIAVGSVDSNMQHSSFSNYGSQIDIWAPGSNILTTKRDGSYGLVSGTSFAAPYVAGAEAIEKVTSHTIVLDGRTLSLGDGLGVLTPTPLTATPIPTPTHTIVTNPQVPGKYFDAKDRFSFAYPDNWSLNEQHWSDTDPMTFDAFIELITPDKEIITLRTWDDEDNQSLTDLAHQHLYPILLDTAHLYDRGEINGNEMIMMSEDGIPNQRPTILYAFFNCNSVTLRIQYIGYHGGTNSQIYRDILETFECNGQSEKASIVPKIEPAIFITESDTLANQGLNPCYGHWDPTEGSNTSRYDCGECTWWAAYSRPDIPTDGTWNYGLDGGNAYVWDDIARENNRFINMVVDYPEVGAIAVWEKNASIGVPAGHVAYVVEVNGDGTFDVTHMNWLGSRAPQRTDNLPDRSDVHFILGGVTFFENQNFGGNWERIRGSQSNLNYGWGISSVFIPAGWDAILYKNSNYDSSSWRERWGEQTVDALNASLWDLQLDYFSDSSNMNNNVRSAKTGLNICFQPFGLTEEGAGNLGCGGPPPPTETPTPPGTIDGFKLISVSSPTVQKGETFPVSITYEVVSGQLLQSRGDHLFGFDPTYGAWPVQAVSGTVNPGQQVTFMFNLTAPQQTGTFESKWQLRVGGNLVGPQAIVRFAVQDTSPPPTNSGPWNSQAWQNKYLAGYPNREDQWTWDDNYPYVYFNWGTGAPYGWGGNEFSMRLWKTIHFPGGYYSFHTTHDDGVKVYLDNTVIIDAWWDGSGGHDIGKTVSAGDHEVKVEYYENQGDANVNVYWYGPGFPEPDTNPPDGRITSPANHSATAAVPLTITADASDDVSGVNRVEFYANYCDGSCGWRLISTDYSLPYSTNWDWSSLADQHVQLTTHMIDNTGKVRMDPGGYVEVDLDRTKPAVSITSPIDGTSLNGDPITITASASDSLSGVWKLEFFAGYNDASGAGAQGIFEFPSPALLETSGELSSAEVSAQGWHVIGWDENGSDGWSLNWTPSDVPDQSGISIFIYAYDHAGNSQGAIRSGLTLQRQIPVDLLFNGGFEEGNTLPVLWSQDAWTASYSTFTWDTAQKHSGAKSVKIDNTTANDARWIQTVYVQQNSNYRLSGWVKTDNVAHISGDSWDDAGANLSIIDGSGNHIYSSPKLFGSNPWTYVTLELNTGSHSQIDVASRLGMYSGTTTGIAWFDDLRLELLSSPQCYTLTKNVNPAGSIAASPVPNCSNGTKYVHGTVVKLTASPAGYGFSNWSGDASGSTNPTYMTMTADKSVTANFRQAASQTFGDVSTGYWAWNFIERLFSAGITGGCNVSPPSYCPEATVTRAQMAVFLLRGIHGSSYSPPMLADNTGFGDVSTTYWAAAWIKQLAADGITGGCGSGNYCPESPVTRAQMAVFLLRSKHGAGYNPPAVGVSTGFDDVPPTSWAAAWIKQLVAEGITAGCGSGNYCPDAPVTRAQMAVFLVRTFGLP